MLNVAYQNQLHLSHLLPRLKLFIPSFYFYCSSYFMGSSGHLGHLDVMPCPFLWQWQLGKIPQNSENKPRGLYFSKALFEGLISGGAYIRRGLSTEGNLHLKVDCASLIVGSKFTAFALFYFVFEGNFPSTSPRGAYIWRGD